MATPPEGEVDAVGDAVDEDIGGGKQRIEAAHLDRVEALLEKIEHPAFRSNAGEDIARLRGLFYRHGRERDQPSLTRRNVP
jgi:hypothetical protein